MSKKISDAEVSIILPNYNSETFVEETIESVINQTFENWKLNIVDDNSNMETKKVLEKYKNHPKINITWLKKNKGAGFCRNIAIRNSTADYIAFIDSDDIWDKEKLSKQIKFMINNNFHFTYTNYYTFKSNKKNILNEVKPAKNFTFEKYIKDTSIGTSTMIIKKSLIGNTKFSKTKICEDYFFKCQILKKAKSAYCLSESLAKYRIRKNSLQSNKLKNIFWIWIINKNFNHFDIFKNLLSVIFISINSLRKYGFK